MKYDIYGPSHIEFLSENLQKENIRYNTYVIAMEMMEKFNTLIKK